MPKVIKNSELNNFICIMHEKEGQRIRKNRNQKINEFLVLRDMQTRMIEEAELKNKGCKIIPCGKYEDLNSCFTFESEMVMFWFNTTKDKSTQLICWNTDDYQNNNGAT